MDISVLGNVWNSAIMYSAEEVNDVRNLAMQHNNLSMCGNGLFGINGSTNVNTFEHFEFSDGYMDGMLCEHFF